jgi:hypothetical protein
MYVQMQFGPLPSQFYEAQQAEQHRLQQQLLYQQQSNIVQPLSVFVPTTQTPNSQSNAESNFALRLLEVLGLRQQGNTLPTLKPTTMATPTTTTTQAPFTVEPTTTTTDMPKPTDGTGTKARNRDGMYSICNTMQ